MSKVSTANFTPDAHKAIRYKVTFTWNDDYRPKEVGPCCITMVVEADNKFAALADAWGIASLVSSAEPTRMDVQRIEVCD